MGRISERRQDSHDALSDLAQQNLFVGSHRDLHRDMDKAAITKTARYAAIVIAIGCAAATWSISRALSSSGFQAAEERHDKFNEMLRAFKALDYETKSSDPDFASMQDS